MFAAIYRTDEAQLMTLGRRILMLDENKPAALLCLDHAFRNLNEETFLTDSDSQVLLKTGALCDYSNLVRDILCVLEPWTKPGILKLFSFTVQSQGRICLPRGTFLHDRYKRSPLHLLDEDAIVEVRVFHNLYQSALRQRLKGKLETYSNMCQSVRVFDPCESAFFGRGCDRNECQRQHQFDHGWFDKRLQFHLFQILILDLLRFFGTEESYNIRRFVVLLSTLPLLLSCILKHLV
jgi:hypothetical protein